MDFGGLDDILDDDIGYIPTAIRREQKSRTRPASVSRQNSTQSIGSMKDAKQEQAKPLFGNTNFNSARQNDLFTGFSNNNSGKQQQKYTPLDIDQDAGRQPVSRRNTLFGAHKQTASIANNSLSNNNQSSGAPISFEQFFKNQNTPSVPSRHPLPESSRPPLPQKKLERNSSFTQLSSPQNIIDDELNNSSVASRRGRPPMSRRNQNVNNDSEVGMIQQNRSENLGTSKGFGSINEISTSNNNQTTNTFSRLSPQKRQQSPSIQPLSFQQQSQSNQPLYNSPAPSIHPTIPSQSLEQLKKVFSNQLQYQKQGFESLINQQRESHKQQVQKLKSFHEEQMKRRLQIKQFEIEKMKEFYQLQLKIHNQRQLQIRQYSSIAKKLQGNMQTIEKLQKNMKDTQFRASKEKQDHLKSTLQSKQTILKQKEIQLQTKTKELQKEKQFFKNEKVELGRSVNEEKTRLYELEVDLRKREAQLQAKYKKLEVQLVDQYDTKSKNLQKQREELRLQFIQLKEQQNLIEVEKLELINSRKFWDNQKKAYLEQIHQQKTKVLEKQIEIASRTGQLEIQEQEIQMNQNDYVNKLKLIELEKKKMEIEKSNTRGQLYLGATSGSLKTRGLLGTTLMSNNNKMMSQTVLQKEFYSNNHNQGYQNQPFEEETNYKKTITQMRDEFLKSLPKF